MSNQGTNSELNKYNIENVLPLTSLQTGMLYHDLVEREQGQSGKSYNQQLSFRITGNLCKNAFEKSWQQLINRHAALRTIYKHDKAAEPVQIVLKNRQFTLHFSDLSLFSPNKQKLLLNDYITKDQDLGFNLENDLLIRLTLIKTSATEHWLLWSFHHIVLDGWCITPLQQELFNLYQCHLSNTEINLAPAPVYSDYIQWIRRQDLHQGFWHQELKNFCDTTSPPLAITSPTLDEAQSNKGYDTVTASINGKLYQQLVVIGEEKGATLSTMVHTLWALYLAKVNTCNDVVFGSVQSTRPMAKGMFDDLIGLCINTIPCRVQFNDTESFSEIIINTQQKMLSYIEHGTTPLSEIKTQCPTSKVLFDHYIAFENYPASPLDQSGREKLAENLYADEMSVFMPTSYPLHLSIFPKGNEVEIAFKYQPNSVDSANVESIANSFIQLSTRLIKESTQALSHFSLLNDEQKIIIKQQSQGELYNLKQHSIMQLYRHNICNNDNAAVIESDLILTHRQLDRASSVLAHQISKLEQQGPIAIFGYAGIEAVIAMFACLKLGIPYVSLDPSTPIKRTQAILTAANVKRVLCTSSEQEILTQLAITQQLMILNLTELLSNNDKIDEISTEPNPKSIAYIIFTSGSTGEPKGVPVTQQALYNYIAWSTSKFTLDETSSSILLTSFYFDLGYTAIYGSLIQGGTLHIANESQRRDPAWLNDYLSQQPISFIKMTPSYLHMLLKSVAPDALFCQSHLKTLILGGEELNFTDLKTISGTSPQLQIFNHYGPSENTIGCCARQLTHEDLIKQQQIIGEPAFNVENYICDQNMALLPTYVEGDLYLAGDQLISSYLNPLNNQDRLMNQADISEQTLYKSGDRAYRDANGQIIFTGREDHSCKVDGYRVDLKSIQQLLIKHLQIKDALVTHFKDNDNHSKIIALIIAEPKHDITITSLRSWLGEQIPAYMQPSEHIMVSRFPITENGKLDRQQLIQFWQHSLQSNENKSVGKPVNHTEFVLLKIWQKILFREQISIDDDFFALGGHSIKAILCLGEIRKKLGAELPIQSIFNSPTIAKLAKLINRTRLDNDLSIENTQHTLLPISTHHKDAKQVVYCLPPAIGTSTIYKELFMALGLPINAYGFQCGGFMPTDDPALSLENLADIAATQIYENYQSVSSKLNAVIVAYSFGAILALEVGKKLEAKGLILPMILIDASVSRTQGAIEYSLSALRENNYWRGVIGILEEHCSEAQFNLITTGTVNNQQRLITYLANKKMSFAKINSPLVCIEATANLESAHMKDFANFTTQKVQVMSNPGDHFSIFQPPNIEILLENLRVTFSDLSKESRTEIT